MLESATNKLDSEDEISKRAVTGVNELKDFYGNLWAYIFANFTLITVNLVTASNRR